MDLRLALRPARDVFTRADDPLEMLAVSLVAELTNGGGERVDVVLPDAWDTDLPDELSHCNLSRGLLWLRRAGEHDVPDQRYSCAEGEGPDPQPVHLEPGGTLSFQVRDWALSELPPGAYEAEVELYTPRLRSDRAAFRVEGSRSGDSGA